MASPYFGGPIPEPDGVPVLWPAIREGLLHSEGALAVMCSARCRSIVQEEKTVSFLSVNAIIRTDGPVILTKPPRGHEKAGCT